MYVPKLPDIVHDRQLLDPHEDLREDTLVGLVPRDGNFVGYLVELR